MPETEILPTADALLEALAFTLDRIYEPLEAAGYKWYLLGSTAGMMQGSGLKPNDVEIMTEKPEALQLIHEIMKDYVSEPLRTVTSPIGVYRCQYGKLEVGGVIVETMGDHWVRNKESWFNESYGSGRWDSLKRIEFRGRQVPIIPMEFIIVTNAYRNRFERVKALAAAMNRNGYDKALLEKVLSSGHLRAAQVREIRQALDGAVEQMAAAGE